MCCFAFTAGMVQLKKNYAKKMKFWQYAVGVVVAILVFAAVVVADMMQYSERASFSQNPFTLLGNQKSTFGGTLEFLETGEMVWMDKGTDLKIKKDERRLNLGTIVLGGTFFPTTKDTALTNQLWFGDVRMYSEFTTALVNVSDEGDVTLLTGGGSVELYFAENPTAVVVPAHTQLEIPVDYVMEKDPEAEYFVVREELKMQVLQETLLTEKLTAAEKTLAAWRVQFGHFAWNIPQLWAIPVGPVVQLLEKITLPLPAFKQARRDFQEEMQPLVEAHNVSNEKAMRTKISKFRQRNLETSLLQRLLIRLDQEEKEWTWFEFAQKYWLPVVAPDAREQNFAKLWMDDEDMAREVIRSIMLLSHNVRVLRADEQMAVLGAELDEMEVHPSAVAKLSRVRRELTAVLNAFPMHRTADNFALLGKLTEKELFLLEGDAKMFVSIEVGQDVVRFVEPLIDFDVAREKVSTLNAVWAKLTIPAAKAAIFSPEELEVIEDIELVKTSGMTPAKVRLMRAQQEEQALLSEQLGEIKEEEAVVDSVISGIMNAKKLWEFLNKEEIQVDITQFRTTRTETEVTTRFANTETGKRQIAGVFDYNAKMFRTLTLGEETTTDLEAHRLGRWMKLIGGKFDMGKETKEEEISEIGSGISQNAPQAILARKLTQEVLKGFSVMVIRDDVEVITTDFQTTRVEGVDYEGAKLTADYSLLGREFVNVKLARQGNIVTRDTAVSVSDMGAILAEMLVELRQN